MRSVMFAIGLGLTCAACASGTRVVLLADDDGTVGQVAVNPGPSETRLTRPLQSATVGASGARVGTETEATVQRDFGAALASMPEPPRTFTLNFEFGSEVLDAASQARLPEIFAEISRRAIADVVIVGHTDTVGTTDYNDRLSLKRAEAVREQLVAAGMDRQIITVWGRGEREPVEPGDEHRSEVNRRAVIIVR